MIFVSINQTKIVVWWSRRDSNPWTIKTIALLMAKKILGKRAPHLRKPYISFYLLYRSSYWDHFINSFKWRYSFRTCNPKFSN